MIHCQSSHIAAFSTSTASCILKPYTGAASRFPDIVAANPAAARALNVSTTQALSQHCLSRHIPLLYLSTDYVFPGRPGEAPYRSNSTPSPPNLYGETKRDGELAVLSTLGEMGLGVVLRVPVLYGSIDPAIGNKESAVNTLLDTVWAAQEPGKETTVDDWAVRYPTNTEDVGRVIVDISIKWVEASEEERKGFGDGVLQYSAEEGMTKYRICEILAEILGVGIGRLKKDSDGGGGGGGASRPYDTKLDTGRLKELGIETRAMRFEEWW